MKEEHEIVSIRGEQGYCATCEEWHDLDDLVAMDVAGSEDIPDEDGVHDITEIRGDQAYCESCGEWHNLEELDQDLVDPESIESAELGDASAGPDQDVDDDIDLELLDSLS